MVRIFYLVVALLVAVMPISCINNEEVSSDDLLLVGDLLPDFSVTMSDGSVVTGAQLRETVSVVLFFNSGCPDCRKTLPSVQRLYDDYSERGVQFALISREEGASSIEEYWAENGYTMPYSAQEDRAIYELFAKSRVPRVYISDDSGRIRAIFTDNPIPTYEVMAEALDELL